LSSEFDEVTTLQRLSGILLSLFRQMTMTFYSLIQFIRCLPCPSMDQSHSVVVLGEPGSGRSALLAALARGEGERQISVDAIQHEFETCIHESPDDAGRRGFRISMEERTVSFSDASGHVRFVRNLATRRTVPDTALVVLDASLAQAGDRPLMSPRVLEQLVLLRDAGVASVVVAVSKMDLAADGAYSHATFQRIETAVHALVVPAIFAERRVSVVPCSAGEAPSNILPRPDSCAEMPWWNGGTLAHALQVAVARPRLTELPLRASIREVYRIGGVGVCPSLQLHAGIIREPQQVAVAPPRLTMKLRSFETRQGGMQGEFGAPGVVAVSLVDATVEQLSSAQVLGDAGSPVAAAIRITALLSVLDEPATTEADDPHWPLRVDTRLSLRWDTRRVNASLVAFQHLDRRTGARVGERHCRADVPMTRESSLRYGQDAIVELVPIDPMCAESFATCPGLGVLQVVLERRCVAAGIVLSVTKAAHT